MCNTPDKIIVQFMPKKRNAPAGPDAVMDGKVNCGVREILKEMDGMETTGLDCGGMGKPLVAGKGEGAEGWSWSPNLRVDGTSGQ